MNEIVYTHFREIIRNENRGIICAYYKAIHVCVDNSISPFICILSSRICGYISFLRFTELQMSNSTLSNRKNFYGISNRIYSATERIFCVLEILTAGCFLSIDTENNGGVMMADSIRIHFGIEWVFRTKISRSSNRMGRQYAEYSSMRLCEQKFIRSCQSVYFSRSFDLRCCVSCRHIHIHTTYYNAVYRQKIIHSTANRIVV